MAIFISVFCWGYAGLRSSSTECSPIALDTYVFGAAVMLADGRGFYEPEKEAVPQLFAFLKGDTQELDVPSLPATIPRTTAEAVPSSEYHRYLNYTTAFFWRLFGISRRSLEPLAALMLAWTAGVVYALMRLGMGRIVALAVTFLFVTSPAVLTMFPQIRDFSKAPFLLTLMYLQGHILVYRPHGKKYYMQVVVLGVIHGIAMGFRQDALMFVPLSLCTLLAAALVKCWEQRSRRQHAHFTTLTVYGIVPLLLYLGLYLLIAWPMLTRMEGGADPYHPLVQGFSAKHAQNLGIKPTFYTPHASSQDNYTYCTCSHFYRRTVGLPDHHFDYNSAGSQEAGRRWLMDMAQWFPADWLTRGYASVFRSLRYANTFTSFSPIAPERAKPLIERFHQRLAFHMHRWGLVYALAALLIISAHNIYSACLLLAAVLFVCGYASLQSEVRHTFYLIIVPLGILGFLSHSVILWIGKDRRCTTSIPSEKSDIISMLRTAGRSTLWRVAAFFGMAALLLVAPLSLVRYYQALHLEPLLQPLMDAPRIPIQTQADTLYGWTTFDIEQNISSKIRDYIRTVHKKISLLFQLNKSMLLPARYLVVAFDGENMPDQLLIRYQVRSFWTDYSQWMRLPGLPRYEGIIYYGFPVYEMYNIENTVFNLRRSRFRGIAVPEKFAQSVVGIYDTKDFSSSRFLMPLLWTDKQSLHSITTDLRLAPYQKIDWIPDPLYYDLTEHSSLAIEDMAQNAAQWGRKSDAIRYWGLRLLFPVSVWQEWTIAEYLMQLNAFDLVLQLAQKTAPLPKSLGTTRLIMLQHILEQSLIRFVETQEAAALHNADDAAQLLLITRLEDAENYALLAGDAYAKHGFHVMAAEHYRNVMDVFPECMPCAQHINDYLNQLVRNKSTTYVPSAESFWEQAAADNPEAAVPALLLAEAHEKSGRTRDALQIYQAVLQQHPDHPEAAARYINCGKTALPIEEIRCVVRRVSISHPEYVPLVTAALVQTANLFMANGRFKDAAALFEEATESMPEEEEYCMSAARALMASANSNKAQEELVSLLTTDWGEMAANELDVLFLQQHPPEKRLDEWERLYALYPSENAVAFKCAIANWEIGNYTRSAALFEDLYAKRISEGPIEIWKVISALSAGIITKEQGVEALLPHRDNPLVKPLLLESANKHLQNGALSDAGRTAGTLSILHPDSEQAWMILGKEKSLENDVKGALQSYFEFYKIASDKKNAGAIVDGLCKEMLASKDCCTLWLQLTESFPEEPVAWDYLGRNYARQNSYADAVYAYRKSREHGNDRPAFLFRYGQALYREGRLDESLQMLDGLAERDAALAGAIAGHCQTMIDDLLLTGNFDSALVAARIAMQCTPDDPFVWMRSGDIFRAMGKMEDAVDSWRKAILIAPNSTIIDEIKRRTKDFLSSEGRQSFWSGVAAQTEGIFLPTLHYAWSLVEDGNCKEAIPFVQKLENNHGDECQVQLISGTVLCCTNAITEGLARIRSTIAVCPDLAADAAQYMALLAKAKESIDKTHPDCLKLLGAAAELDPHNPYYNVLLGELLLELEKPREASAQFITVLLAAPESPRTAELLDETLRILGDRNARKKTWQRLADAHPGVELLKRYLAESGISSPKKK